MAREHRRIRYGLSPGHRLRRQRDGKLGFPVADRSRYMAHGIWSAGDDTLAYFSTKITIVPGPGPVGMVAVAGLVVVSLPRTTRRPHDSSRTYRLLYDAREVEADNTAARCAAGSFLVRIVRRSDGSLGRPL